MLAGRALARVAAAEGHQNIAGRDIVVSSTSSCIQNVCQFCPSSSLTQSPNMASNAPAVCRC